MKTLQTLLQKLHEAGLAISLDKCIFGVDSLEFLGYKVDSKGITPLPKKLSAIHSIYFISTHFIRNQAEIFRKLLL